jgi:hypothetical protein
MMKTVAKPETARGAAFPRLRVQHRGGLEGLRGIAEVAHALQHRLGPDGIAGPGDGQLAGGKIEPRLRYAGDRPDAAFDLGDAAGAACALDRDFKDPLAARGGMDVAAQIVRDIGGIQAQRSHSRCTISKCRPAVVRSTASQAPGATWSISAR